MVNMICILLKGHFIRTSSSACTILDQATIQRPGPHTQPAAIRQAGCLEQHRSQLSTWNPPETRKAESDVRARNVCFYATIST